jgi:hypothetical protein
LERNVVTEAAARAIVRVVIQAPASAKKSAGPVAVVLLTNAATGPPERVSPNAAARREHVVTQPHAKAVRMVNASLIVRLAGSAATAPAMTRQRIAAQMVRLSKNAATYAAVNARVVLT